jgi:hypothetical protein
MSMPALTFACVFITLYAAHHVGDYWIQTHHQACTKGLPGWTGRLVCARHVATMTATKALALLITVSALQLSFSGPVFVLAMSIDAASHYWADRRTTLARLADWVGIHLINGKGDYYRLGTPRPGHDDNPTTGTGASDLDQAWHITWLWITALLIAAL